MRIILVERLGNLSNDELNAAFAQYGTVERVSIITDGVTGQLRGFAFVEPAANQPRGFAFVEPAANQPRGFAFVEPAANQPRGFAFVELAANEDIPKELAQLNGCRLASTASPKLLSCWIQAHAPTGQIEEITSLATTVLEDSDKAEKWLTEANPATDNRAPIELIGEPQGFERVKNVLLRIEYGVLA